MSHVKHRLAALIFGAALTAAAHAQNNSFPANFDPFPRVFTRVNGEYRLSIQAYTYYYMAFEHTVDLLQPWTTLKMALGTPAAAFGFTPGAGETRGFLRIAAIDVFSPRDTDGDGIDDLWELYNSLDPVNPADALLPNATNPSMTNLEYYRNRFGLSRVTNFVSSEVTIYNHPFAISQEVSVFNFPNATGVSKEAISAEVTVFNIPTTSPTFKEAISAEVSVFNIPITSPTFKEAISAEVTVSRTP